MSVAVWPTADQFFWRLRWVEPGCVGQLASSGQKVSSDKFLSFGFGSMVSGALCQGA